MALYACSYWKILTWCQNKRTTEAMHFTNSQNQLEELCFTLDRTTWSATFLQCLELFSLVTKLISKDTKFSQQLMIQQQLKSIALTVS